MQRRTFIHHSARLTGVLALLPDELSALPTTRDTYTRYVVTSVDGPPVSFPVDKRVPLGLRAFPVPTAPDSSVVLRLPTLSASSYPWYVRLTAAIDVREEKVVELYLPQSGQTIGTLTMKYAHPFQPFQTPVQPQWLSAVQQQGLGLRLGRGTSPAWFFLPEGLPPDGNGLAPQLLTGPPATESVFWQTLYSMNSFSPFGWMGGCVHDALYALHQSGNQRATRTLKIQLGHYLDDRQGIILESPDTRPLDGTFNSIEDFLPFAAIVDRYPDHPSVQQAVDFCLAHRNEQGIIMAGEHLTTEGCYTVAYPLAAIARARQDSELAQIALDQLRYRTRYLVDESAIYQRATLAGDQAYRNWGRGVAWYLLGTIKTLAVLRDSSLRPSGTDEVREAWVTAARTVQAWQSKDRLWYGYLDRPETAVDTSASAGIAAARAWGAHLKLLPARSRREAETTYRSLLGYLTPDGFLTQVSQINRGGEALQASGYRVISQFGLGLMGQLRAAIDA